MKTDKETPLSRQYKDVKTKYPNSIVLFRLGDFYETFGEDAIVTARVCGIMLTKRNNGSAQETELAGFPYHQIDNYLPKLVRAGHRVAVCEQLEDPKMAKGIVKRGVVEVVTPGVAFYEKLLDAKKNNYLMAIAPTQKSNNEIICGFSFCDVSTGEFRAGQCSYTNLRNIIEQIAPSEIVISRSSREDYSPVIELTGLQPAVTRLDDWLFEPNFTMEKLLKHFQTQTLKGFGLDVLPQASYAAGVVLHYIEETQKNIPNHINTLSVFHLGGYMILDSPTRKNLEIYFSGEGTDASLLGVIDKTSTALGSRLIKKWLAMPLTNLVDINKRLEITQALFENDVLRKEISSYLSQVADLERLNVKISTGRTIPRDFIVLKNSLQSVANIKKLILESSPDVIKMNFGELDEIQELIDIIDTQINDEAGTMVGNGSVFKKGVYNDYDELLSIKSDGKKWISDYQIQQRELTGVNSLKVSYNNVFGYYIEISKAHNISVPQEYDRKQTLSNAERYTSPYLKELESKILGAEELISNLENQLFTQFRIDTQKFANRIFKSARLIAELDVFCSFAVVAVENNYCCPTLDESTNLSIIGGRHPVIEKRLPIGNNFTPNSSKFDEEAGVLHLITGPNMSGKSCYLRQIGLIVLMAQCGSFVPADSAKIGIVDRIFTRVGAQDNMAAGESTFLVEMQESANILNNATNKSLILLDEVGRGTATYDGISIAQAMVEYIHDEIAAKTLFATHFHELNELEKSLKNVRNYKVSVLELNNKIVFSHKVVLGFSDHSFGLHVAKMAGLPEEVILRGEQILEELEKAKDGNVSIKTTLGKIEPKDSHGQLAIFAFNDDTIRNKLRGLKIENITPLDSLKLLHELVELAKK